MNLIKIVIFNLYRQEICMSTTAQAVIEKIHSDFQKEIVELWNKKNYYMKFLEETGMSSKEALVQIQGCTPLGNCNRGDCAYFAAEYIRIGRQDIANLFNKLQDPANGVVVFSEAQKKYHEDPDYNYGAVLSYCLDNGLGTKINKKAAFEIDLVFAKQNHPIALCSVANEYFSGDIVTADLKMASELYQRAIELQQQSFYLPHVMWGQRLLKGDGIEKDETQALYFLNLADKQECGLASISLMGYYAEKLNRLEAALADPAATAVPSPAEIQHTKEQVYFYAAKADNLGLAYGKYLLAECYFKGWGVDQDKHRYLELANQSMTAGCVSATEMLAQDYQYGLEGILASDPIRALTLYFSCFRRNKFNALENFKALIADNINNPEFMINTYDSCKKCLQGHLLDNALDSTVIGIFYQDGILLPKNIEIAAGCLLKGADEGLEEAANALIKLARHKESAGLVPVTFLKKYFAYADEDEIADVRLYYQTSYIPLFQALKQAWPTNVAVPNSITGLISDYAVSTLDEHEKIVSASPS